MKNNETNEGTGKKEEGKAVGPVSFGMALLRPKATGDSISPVAFSSIESGEEEYMGELSRCVRIQYVTENGAIEVLRINEYNARNFLTRFLTEGNNFTKARYVPAVDGEPARGVSPDKWTGFIPSARGEDTSHWALQCLFYDALSLDVSPEDFLSKKIFGIDLVNNVGMLIYAERSDRRQSEPSFGLLDRLKIKTQSNVQMRQRRRSPLTHSKVSR